MHYPTIYTSPSERPKFDFLQTHNYLSEYSSEVDKMRVRQNLGIPDEFSLYWGNIKGNIANQTDIISLINEVKQGLNNTYGTTINSITTNVSSINQALVTQSAKITQHDAFITEMQPYLTELRSIYNTLLEVKTDVAQNATDIRNLSISGGSSSGGSTDSALSARVAELAATQSTILARLTVLEANLNEVTVTEIVLDKELINATTASDLIDIAVTARYSNGTSKNILNEVTVNSSNTNVISWENAKAKVNGAGTATLTFSYSGVSKVLNVTIESAEQVVYSYIGFAMDYNDVLASNDCRVTEISGSFTPHAVEAAPYYLWIITPKVIRSITENNVATYEVPGNNVALLSKQYQGITYNVYKFHGDGDFGEADTLNGQTTITITTN